MSKIAIYIYSLRRDGAQRVAINLARHLVGCGDACTIITDWTDDAEYVVPSGVKRVSLNQSGNNYVHYLGNIRKMRALLREEAPDLLLVMQVTGCLLAVPAAKGQAVKVIVSERNDPTHFPGKRITNFISRRLMKKADGYVFQTEEAMAFYREISGKPSVIIPNPVYCRNMPKYSPEKCRRHEIVAVGRLVPQKNQKLLIRAFARIHKRFSDYRLIIYGEGVLRESLLEEIRKLNLSEFVSLPGNKPDVLERINQASIFVMPSDFEGMPNALLEAMALGLPCISTDCPIGGPRAVIHSGDNGILVSVGSEVELASAIERLIEHPDLRESMSKNALDIRNALDSERICQCWYDFFKSVLDISGMKSGSN